MKKFLLSLAILAAASPAWAVSISDWQQAPIVSGDKTFTLNSTDITDINVAVNVQDFGFSHQLNLSNLAGVTSDFNLNFTVTVSTGPNKISSANVTQNVFLTGTPSSTTDWASGTYFDTLTGSDTGPVNAFDTTSLTIDTASQGLAAGNTLSNITYSFTQTNPTVPEPGTLVLAGLGFAGLVIARRRTAK